MREFKNKVAVITGACSGIGKALAQQSASLGMHVVLADIDSNLLKEVEDEITETTKCRSVLAVQTDVSSHDDIKELARHTINNYGKVHLLFNNAGVILDKKIWEYEIEDWDWVLGVDLYGVIYGVKTFLPIMESQNEDSHIVNVASISGFISSPTVGAYKVAKHGVVALTEVLYYDLASKNSCVHTSLLAPSWTNTAIRDCEKHRPKRFRNGESITLLTKESRLRDREVRERMAIGMKPEYVAEVTFSAISKNQFYIFPNETEAKERIRERMRNILLHGRPVIVPEMFTGSRSAAKLKLIS